MATSRKRTQPRAASLDAFFARIELARKLLDFKKHEECFFRGHGSSEWPLLPTLLRRAGKQWDEYELRDTEATLYWEFQTRARELHDRQLSDWDLLFHMREHGVATRLLDWSETLAVALFFALQDCKEGVAPCIWLLNPYLLNKKSWGNRDLIAPQYLCSANEDEEEYSDLMADYDADFGWKNPVALYPTRRNERLHVQRGYFTIHGRSRRPLEKTMPDAVRQVVIEPREVKMLGVFLERAGINEHALFPDLDALARYLNRRYALA